MNRVVTRVVIGVGNEWRRDDGAGIAAAQRIRSIAPETVRVVVSDGEPARLVEAWEGSDLAVVIDATSDGEPGQAALVAADELEPRLRHTHGGGVGAAVALADVLDRRPGRLVLVAVTGTDFGHGVGLTPDAARGVDAAVALIGPLLQAP